MEPPRSWGPAQAAAWLRGLDAAVQGYPFEAWGLSGPELLGLEPGLLEALGVRPVGHQELLLEAVEQLRSLDSGLASTSLRTLTERLRELARGIQGLVQGKLWAEDAPRQPSLTLLARAIELLGAAKELFSWLNRYLFSTLNDFSASQDIIVLCAQLADTLQADIPAAQRSSGILQICQHIEGICESIVGCSPPALLDRRAVLQSVGLALLPRSQGSPETPALLPGPQGSPPASPETPALLPGPQGSPPASPETPALLPGPQGSPETPTLLPGPQGSPETPTLLPGPQGSPPASPSTPTLLPGPQGSPETPTLLPGPQGSPPASPDTPTLLPGPQGSPPASPDTPALLPGPQGSPETPTLLPGPQGSPPASPSTPTLPLGLWHSPPASSDTPTPPPSQWSSPPGSPETPTPPCDVLGSPQALLTARLGFEVTSTSSCLHFVSATSPGAPAARGGLVLPGDEIVQVNEQVVVGWTPVSLARKLLEEGDRVTLVLKKIPLGVPGSPPSPRQQSPGAFLDAADSPGTRSGESPGSPVSLSSSVAADLDSGAESAPDPGSDEEQEEAEREPRAAAEERPGPAGQGAAEELWDSGAPLDTPLDTPPAPEPPGTELSPGAAEPGPAQGSPSTARRPKGVATRLSRRRVSCRDLGRADCDGWLLKKKEHVGFMAQKWKRCWVVLKGHTLYWYNHPNDERAAGLINLATYNLESTREQKKKYVFQLCHQTYKPFVFAAETLADLSMWVSHLVTAKTKHTLAQQAVPDKEEDCYSETEAEDPDDEAPRHGSDPARKRLQNSQEKAQLSPGSSPQGSPRPCSPLDPGAEELASLARCLRQGGLSLTGQRRALTQEQCRTSFLRRNRNPHINERVHAVRALQSTLKAKLAELQALEQLLGEAALTSDTFRRWKEEHQELYQELREGWAGQRGQGGAGQQHGEAAEP